MAKASQDEMKMTMRYDLDKLVGILRIEKNT
jgi:hypothetical protein